MEMLKAVGTFFRKYEVIEEDSRSDWTVDGGFIKGQSGINVILKIRQDFVGQGSS